MRMRMLIIGIIIKVQASGTTVMTREVMSQRLLSTGRGKLDDAEEAAEEHQGGYVIFSNLGIGCVKSRDMCHISGDGS